MVSILIFVDNLAYLVYSNRGGMHMPWSYNRLWVMLIYKGIKRTHLIKLAGINAAALAKMGKNQTVSMDILGKLCEYFDCGIEDIVEYVPEGGEALPPTARSK